MSICVICEKSVNSGVITNGDAYGDGKFVGIKSAEWGFYCWDDYKKAPDLNKEIDEAFKKAGMCGFLKAWIGRCRNPMPCSEHATQKCWKCGGLATRNCSETGILVCGMPECDEHPHIHTPRG